MVKLPATLDAVRVATILAGDGVRCALTAVYSPAQALLAHEVGCVWVIPYVDRAARQSVGGLVVVDALAAILERLQSGTRILAASLKSAPQVVDSILHGAHDVTAPLDVLVSLAGAPADRVRRAGVRGSDRVTDHHVGRRADGAARRRAGRRVNGAECRCASANAGRRPFGAASYHRPVVSCWSSCRSRGLRRPAVKWSR